MSNARIGTTDKKFYALHIETLIKNVSLTIFLASTAIAEWLSKMQSRSTKNIFLMLPTAALLNHQTFCSVLFFSLEIFSYKIFKYKHISHFPLITKNNDMTCISYFKKLGCLTYLSDIFRQSDITPYTTCRRPILWWRPLFIFKWQVILVGCDIFACGLKYQNIVNDLNITRFRIFNIRTILWFLRVMYLGKQWGKYILSI